MSRSWEAYFGTQEGYSGHGEHALELRRDVPVTEAYLELESSESGCGEQK